MDELAFVVWMAFPRGSNVPCCRPGYANTQQEMWALLSKWNDDEAEKSLKEKFEVCKVKMLPRWNGREGGSMQYDEIEVELTITVVVRYEVMPAEPDVGLPNPYAEIKDVVFGGRNIERYLSDRQMRIIRDEIRRAT